MEPPPRYSRSRMRPARRLLILDDDTELVEAVARHLERHGYSPTRTYMVGEAIAAIDQSIREALPFQAIVTDLQLPDGDGRAIVRPARDRLPGCPELMMTESGSISGPVEATRLVAVTVLQKPVSLETLGNLCRQASY